MKNKILFYTIFFFFKFRDEKKLVKFKGQNSIWFKLLKFTSLFKLYFLIYINVKIWIQYCKNLNLYYCENIFFNFISQFFYLLERDRQLK